MAHWLQRLKPKSAFARGVGVLVGGTAFAQAIAVLALPLLTRLYTPDDFSVLAVYAALLGIISVVACLRLEIAIPMPEDEGTAINLMLLGLIFSPATAVLVGLILLFFSAEIAALLKQPGLRSLFWMLPLGIWFSGVYAAVQYWSTRQKRFTMIAQTRMAQAVGSTGMQLGFGLLGKFGPFGLLLGQMMTAGIGIFQLGRLAWRDVTRSGATQKHENLWRTLRRYDRFPKYSTFEAFANAAAMQLPVVIIGAAAIGPEAGFLLLAMKAAGIPMGLIGGAIAQVYLSRASDEWRAGRLPQFTTQIIVRLTALGVGPLVAIGIVAPSVMPLVFGTEWARAGVMISWMTPWFIMQFLASPVSMSLHVTDNQPLALLNQLGGLVLRVGLTALAARYLAGHVVEVYAVSGLVFYFIYLAIVLRVSGVRLGDLGRASRKGLLIVGAWSVVAVAATLALDLLLRAFMPTN